MIKSGINLYLYAVDRYGIGHFSSMDRRYPISEISEHNITRRPLEAPFAPINSYL